MYWETQELQIKHQGDCLDGKDSVHVGDGHHMLLQNYKYEETVIKHIPFIVIIPNYSTLALDMIKTFN